MRWFTKLNAPVAKDQISLSTRQRVRGGHNFGQIGAESFLPALWHVKVVDAFRILGVLELNGQAHGFGS